MSNVLNYINTNNLPCITWIDATDPTKLTISGSTFVALNKVGNTAYDFIQTNPSLHPIITTNGISFTGNKRLSPRQADIFSPVLNSPDYSMIFITKGNPTINQQLLAVAKNNPSLPKFLDIRQGNNASKQSFSNVNLENFLEFDSFTGNTQTLMFTHNIRLGKTDVSVNKAPFNSYINLSKGYILNNFPSSFYLGNSQNTLPFIGELLHFLIFVPGISNTHMLSLANLLTDTKPVLDALSTDFIQFNNAEIDLSSNIELATSIVYTAPLVINNSYKAAFIDLSYEISLSFFFNWNALLTEDWDNMTTDYWDNLATE